MSGPGFTVEGRNRGWIVCKNGQKVYGPVTMRSVAEDARDRLERAARCKERACLTCGELFLSEGPHHRMCARCRAEARAMGW